MSMQCSIKLGDVLKQNLQQGRCAVAGRHKLVTSSCWGINTTYGFTGWVEKVSVRLQDRAECCS
jgi:hypothetical protein